MIEIHSHLFNLRYLPVQGILRRFTNNIVPDIIAGPVANALIRHTASDFVPMRLIPVTLKEKINGLKPLLKTVSVFDLEINAAVENIVDNFSADEINNLELQNALVTFYQIIQNDNKAAEFKLMFKKLNNKAIINLNTHDYLSFSNGLKKMLIWICNLIDKAVGMGVNFIRWVYVMLQSESDLFAKLQKDVPHMKYYIHLMMDVDNYFNSKASYFDYETQQVPNMQQLNNKFKDKLIGFVAYDPSKENSLDIIKDAIENRGYKGVKFYPPMGYRATGNVGDKQIYDERNAELFRYCIKNDLPILTHCNNSGFEAEKNSGYNSNPLFWQDLLSNDEFKKLRLCLAHGGGVQGWFCAVDKNDQMKINEIDNNIFDASDKQINWNSSYAKIVYKLCINPEFPNIYCDAAYLDEINNADKLSNFTARLIKLFKTEPVFAKKIMFGTDWHMLFREGENANFFTGYDKLFALGGVLGSNREDFFEKNAVNYLKIA